MHWLWRSAICNRRKLARALDFRISKRSPSLVLRIPEPCTRQRNANSGLAHRIDTMSYSHMTTAGMVKRTFLLALSALLTLLCLASSSSLTGATVLTSTATAIASPALAQAASGSSSTPPAATTPHPGAGAKLTFRRVFKSSTPEFIEITVREDSDDATFDIRQLEEDAAPSPFQVTS